MNILKLLRQIIRGLVRLSGGLTEIQQKIDEQKILAAKLLIGRMRSQGIHDDIRHAEFKVFSQYGDDGIIQYLIHNIEIESRTFVEFGVENYQEANTRFLLVNDNWRGLVIDGSSSNVEFVKRDPIYWQHDLTAVREFITTDNINEVIEANGFAGELGLLSIDIDGNDYWVWEAVEAADPEIVVVEYNSVFGSRRAVTVPYDPSFNRTSAHPSNLYFGCSLRALDLLARKKGYVFVGSNSAGNNAYFVRRDKAEGLKSVGVEAGYVESRFRESRDAEGRMTFLSGDARRHAIGDLQVFDVEESRLVRISEL